MAMVSFNTVGETNEVTTLDRDIFVMANPSIANLPGWVIGLVVAGAGSSALNGRGLLMVISSAVSHDLAAGPSSRT